MKKALLLLMIFAPSCGTYVGNGINPTGNLATDPRTGLGVRPEYFLQILDEYKYSRANNCGSYSENSTEEQVENGRNCIMHARVGCMTSKYLYDGINQNGSRFASFVSVYPTSPGSEECQIYVHTVSNDPGNEIIDAAACAKFTMQIPELACGIGPSIDLIEPSGDL